MYSKIDKDIFKIPFILDPNTKDFKLNKNTNIITPELQNDVSNLFKKIWGLKKWSLFNKTENNREKNLEATANLLKKSERNKIIEKLFYEEGSNCSMMMQEDNKESIENELANFLITQRNQRNLMPVLTYWKYQEQMFPGLASVMRDVLSIQASQASSERLFSSGANFYDYHRNRTKNTTLKICLLLKNWMGKNIK